MTDFTPDTDRNGLRSGLSFERFRDLAMKMLFDRMNTECEGTVAVNRQAIIVWMSEKYARLIGLQSSAEAIGQPIESVLPASRMREVVETGQPILLDLMPFGPQHFVVTRLPMHDDHDNLMGAIGFVLFDHVRQLRPTVEKYRLLERQLAATRQALASERRARYTIANFIGNSAVANEIKRQARRAAQIDAAVLLRGETGTGKELLAQGIHNLSARVRGPFVAVNMAAIPAELVEAELFGTVAGAYTGAQRQPRVGKFELANGGTLFLDEIGDLPVQLQAKLLRVLQEQQVEPLGSNQIHTLDVRIIAATHVNLEQRLRDGAFRSDLYYRLNVLQLHVPSLRERCDDLPQLVECIIDEIASRTSLPAIELTPAAIARLQRHPWPGNVRELRNCLESLQLLADGQPIDEAVVAQILPSLPPGAVAAPCHPPAQFAPPTSASDAELAPLAVTLAAAERVAVLQALQHCGGNRRLTAEHLGISRATLYNKLQEHQLQGFQPATRA